MLKFREHIYGQYMDDVVFRNPLFVSLDNIDCTIESWFRQDDGYIDYRYQSGLGAGEQYLPDTYPVFYRPYVTSFGLTQEFQTHPLWGRFIILPTRACHTRDVCDRTSRDL